MSESEYSEWYWSAGIMRMGLWLVFLGGLAGLADYFFHGLLSGFLADGFFLNARSLGLLPALAGGTMLLGAAVSMVSWGRSRLLQWEEPLTELTDALSGSRLLKAVEKQALPFSLLLLAVLVIWLYHNTLDIFFVGDDFSHLMLVQGEPWYALFDLGQYFWRPMGMMLYRWLYHSFRLNPLPYHLTYLAVHIINAALVYFLVQQLLGKRMLSLLASIIFVTRFALFYNVAVTNTQDSIAAVFILLTIIFYIKSVSKYRYNIISLLLCAMAVMTKETAVVTVSLLFFYEFFFQCSFGEGWRRRTGASLKRLLPHVLLVSGYFLVRALTGKLLKSQTGMYRMGIGKNTISHLVNYPRFSFNGPLDPSLIMVVILTGLVIYKLMKKQTVLKSLDKTELKGFFYGVFWFFASLSPAMIIWFFAKHYLYLPIIGFSLAMALLVYQLYKKIRTGSPGLANLFVFLFLLLDISFSYVKINGKAVAGKGYIQYGSSARSYIADLQKDYPQLPQGATLYFFPKSNKVGSQYLWNVSPWGNLFRLFYDDKTIISKYIVKEDLAELEPDGKTFAFGFDRMHLYDFTSFIGKKNER